MTTTVNVAQVQGTKDDPNTWEMEGDYSVTAIIPTFNRKHLVLRAVSSCVDQVDKIIVVDDGSTDGTDTLVWPDKVTYVRFDENRGVHEARNAGMELVDTDAFFFLDSDDVLAPQAVATCLPKLEDGY